MKQQLNLTISKPCSEKFNQFNKTKNGAFCNSCNKEVVDFRSMSDKQLSNYFKSKASNTCGYFDTSQLNRNITISEFKKRTRFKYLRVAALAFLSLASFNYMQAQVQKPKTEIIESTKINTKIGKTPAQEQRLSGTVVEEFGPLPGANIILKGTTVGTSTNFDGAFIFPKALKEGDVLVVSYLGFVTKEIKIKKEQTKINTILNIELQQDVSCVLMGEVEVNNVYQSKPTLWQKIKRIF
ncbi:carboxypeptidase-like regulatory domain-containing protein [uncultured Algibacter sp.]|uniref:carboxypeptidase-like regulatory domain-containing protein n=1 Tax=uncultured Algibacter sp. TaxID=298659 RepID=UPI00262C5356|nr:carboxypeptidase-like regulatory domain-containing protein [uncultured Algibacter sp.]